MIPAFSTFNPFGPRAFISSRAPFPGPATLYPPILYCYPSPPVSPTTTYFAGHPPGPHTFIENSWNPGVSLESWNATF